MRRLLLLPMLLCATLAAASAHTTITGRVLGYNDKPMAMAHVHLVRPMVGEPIVSVTAGKDGSFTLTTEETGLLTLQFTGVDHMMHEVPLLVTSPTNVKLTAQLKANSFKLEDVKIIGDFNKFSFSKGVPMVKQPNGTYVAEFKSDEKTMAYQILTASGERSVNGTQSDAYAYDGGGDYRSIVNVKKGVARIVFDPKKLIKSERLAEVRFADPASTHARFAAIMRDANVRQEAFFAAVTEFKASAKEPSSFSYDWSPELQKVATALRSERDPILRQALYIGYLQMIGYGAKGYDKEVVNAARTEIAPASPLWAINPDLVGSLFPENGQAEEYDRYSNAVIENNPDENVKAYTLYNKVAASHYIGETEKSRLYYDRLMKEYPNTQFAQMAERQFDPNRTVMAGKTVPEFTVVSLDQPGVNYSNESMKGKYYLIDFWATWCGPCIGEMENMHAAYQKYKGMNFEIISLSFDAKPEDVGTFRGKKWKMPWLHTFVDNGFRSDLATRFEVSGIPKPILVDPSGKILAVDSELRGANLDKTLGKYLGAN